MKNGNVANFPIVQTRSYNITCSEPVTTPYTFTWTGQIILSVDPETSEPTQVTDYSMTFTVVDDNKVKFSALIPSAKDFGNYVAMNYGSDQTEEIYGMGLQYSVWDFKGYTVPLIVDEGGVGRGLQPISDVLAAKGDGEQGSVVTSYAPAATYITNRDRAFIFD